MDWWPLDDSDNLTWDTVRKCWIHRRLNFVQIIAYLRKYVQVIQSQDYYRYRLKYPSMTY